MNNFGVIEVASKQKANAPGWAYVPDTAVVNPAATLQPTSRKRARGQSNIGLSDLASSRQDTRLRKELEALDRDSSNARHLHIPIPPKPGRTTNTSSRAPSIKHTPTVRKILQSQKTFANYLDDFEARRALNESQGHAHSASGSGSGGAAAAAGASGSSAGASGGGGGGSGPGHAFRGNQHTGPNRSSARRPSIAASKDKNKKRDSIASTPTTPVTPLTANPLASPSEPPEAARTTTTTNTSATHPPSSTTPTANPPSSILTPLSPSVRQPSPHLGDRDPLLASAVPALPDDATLRALITAPPLTYNAARAGYSPQYPVRVFCEVCGYWGRVKCIKCAGRVCALDCLEIHREECLRVFGI